MAKKSEQYFTVGEFANLFGISKQTLFYYERNKIFCPDFIDENGYRYYSLEQYFIFEIIVTLRKLRIPLQKIAAYIQNRNINNLQKLFLEKQIEYDQKLELLKRNKYNLQVKIDHLEQIKKIRIDKITLENCPEEYLVTNKFSNLAISKKDKLKLVAKHNLPFSASEILNEYVMGYILQHEQLIAKDYMNISHIFTRVSHPEEYKNVFIKPEGLYAKICTPNGHHSNYKNAFAKLSKFIELNNLCILGNAYITQLRNYWSTPNPDEYITQIAIQVEYAD